MITITPQVLEDFDPCCRRAIRIAQKSGDVVEFKFNGIITRVNGDSNTEDAWEQHKLDSNSLFEAYNRAFKDRQFEWPESWPPNPRIV